MRQPPIDWLRPDVFSRHALESTFTLLRPVSPPLALEIQNILAGEKLSLDKDINASAITDHFHICLAPQIIGRIIESLTQLGQTALNQDNQGPNQLAVIRRLIKQWMTMAEWIILQAEQANRQQYP